MSASNQISAEGGIAGWLSRAFGVIAATALFLLMGLTCVDVAGRYLFNRPVTGSTELTEIAVAIIVFSSLPVISWRNKHIVVDIFDRFFSRRWHIIRQITVNIIIAVALIFLGWRIYVLASRSLGYGELSEYLGIPVGYVSGFIALMCWVTAALMLTLGTARILHRPAFSRRGENA